MTRQRINDAGLAIIKEFEGLSLTPYLDAVGIPTIGYGHNGGVSMETPPITREEAEELLRRDVQAAERAVSNAVFVSLNEHQYSACVSLCFNIGAKAFRDSTLARLVNQGNLLAAASQFPRWRWAGGRILPGLVRRRAAERALFEKPVSKEAP